MEAVRKGPVPQRAEAVASHITMARPENGPIEPTTAITKVKVSGAKVLNIGFSPCQTLKLYSTSQSRRVMPITIWRISYIATGRQLS
jgi:hypothetical protein